MNERLKQLATQAYRSVNPGPDPYNEAEAAWLGFGPLERKFAELIVRECVNVADEVSMDDTVGYALLEHFGVEE
jgi:hypothetical protein